MPDEQVTLSMSRADAEVLLGVLSSERYNPEVEAVCDGLRRQLNETPLHLQDTACRGACFKPRSACITARRGSESRKTEVADE
jgi:hypothetical protein